MARDWLLFTLVVVVVGLVGIGIGLFVGGRMSRRGERRASEDGVGVEDGGGPEPGTGDENGPGDENGTGDENGSGDEPGGTDGGSDND